MKEEKYLIEKCGKENPFKTPEGYFENLTRNIMNNFLRKKSKLFRKRHSGTASVRGYTWLPCFADSCSGHGCSCTTQKPLKRNLHQACSSSALLYRTNTLTR